MKGKWWVINGIVAIVILLAVLIFVGVIVSFSNEEEMRDDYERMEGVYNKLYNIDYASTKKEASKINGKVRDAKESLKLCRSEGVFSDTYQGLSELIKYLETQKLGSKHVRHDTLIDSENSLVDRYNDVVDKMNDIKYENAQSRAYDKQLDSWDKELKQKRLGVDKLEKKIEKVQNRIIESLENINSSLRSLKSGLDDMNLWDFLWVSY